MSLRRKPGEAGLIVGICRASDATSENVTCSQSEVLRCRQNVFGCWL